MKLKLFRVQNFRSFLDSGWINCQDITAIAGVNEAGKSNLLKALWKLKPAFQSDNKISHFYVENILWKFLLMCQMSKKLNYIIL